MHDPLLHTKLIPPILKPGLVSRPHLLALLDEGFEAGKKLILVSAPVGYGKTTLVGEWVHRLECRRAWLTLDKDDNDEQRFLSYLSAALQSLIRADQEGGKPIFPVEPYPANQAAARSVLTSLINTIHQIDSPAVLVLDDYHAIQHHNLHELCSYLLRNLPPLMRLVIVTRSDPPLTLASLRGRGQMQELRLDSLRFSTSDASRFLTGYMQVQVSQDDIERLVQRTEGWIAGLQMVGLSLKGRSDPSLFIRKFSGEHRYILEYLVEEILEQQPEKVQTFLMCTSILERLCAPLCDAILETKNEGAAMLAHLERANLFLIPLDEEHTWFRYHPLFSDLLKARLNLIHAGMNKILAARAADWCSQNHLLPEAIEYALAAADHPLAGKILEKMVHAMLYSREVFAIPRWVTRLPVDLLRAHPWLGITQAFVLTLLGGEGDPESFLRDAEKIAQSTSLEGGERDELLGQLYCVWTFFSEKTNNPEGAQKYIREYEKYVHPQNPRWMYTFRLAGYIYLLTGDLKECERVWCSFHRQAQRTGNRKQQARALCALAQVKHWRGHLQESAQLYREALQMSDPNQPFSNQARFGLSSLLLDQNALQEADKYLKEAAILLQQSDSRGIGFFYMRMAHMSFAQKKLADAEGFLQKAYPLLQNEGYLIELWGEWERLRVLIWLEKDDFALANDWLFKTRAENQGNPLTAKNMEQEQLLACAIWLHGGIRSAKSIQQALALLDELVPAIEKAGHGKQLVSAWVYRSLAELYSDHLENAVFTLEKALLTASRENLQRPFLDAGSALLPLLKVLNPSDPQVKKFLSDLMAALQKETGVEEDVPAGNTLEALLSAREREVLHCICQGYSNQQIAEKLFITINTVKRHTNHIFNKLGVENRSQALLEAQRLGLTSIP